MVYGIDRNIRVDARTFGGFRNRGAVDACV